MNKVNIYGIMASVLFVLTAAGAVTTVHSDSYTGGFWPMLIISMIVVFCVFAAIIRTYSGMKIGKWIKTMLSPMLFTLETTVSTQLLMLAALKKIDDEFEVVALFAIHMYLLPFFVNCVALIPKYLPMFLLIKILSGRIEYDEDAVKLCTGTSVFIIWVSNVISGVIFGFAIPLTIVSSLFVIINCLLLKAEYRAKM